MYGQNELTPKQKAAILLISLGPEVSSQVFFFFFSNEMEKLMLDFSCRRRVSLDLLC